MMDQTKNKSERFLKSHRLFGGCVVLALVIATGMSLADAQTKTAKTDLAQLGLEDLMNLEVTLASKREERLFHTAAAVFVITQEDIRRSGATTIPEALRLVPGLQIARIDSAKWAITARGFNGRFANKLLVLMDGRTLYTPLFSGVYWEDQDFLLEDVERIEVIRGPGAALWGANAVNGVINIITKRAEQTQGGLVVLGAGAEQRGFGAIRFGGKVGDSALYRVYGKYYKHDKAVSADSRPAVDGWDALRGGLRLDWQVAARDSLTLQGDIYGADYDQLTTGIVSFAPPFFATFLDPVDSNGGNFLGRWSRLFEGRSDMALQTYYDRTRRADAGFTQHRETFDIDFQHHRELRGRQEVVWGAGYRYTSDRIQKGFGLSYDPASRGDSLFNVFLHDEIEIAKDRFKLAFGVKFEHNNYTGFEVQPSGRFLWTPSNSQTLWGAVSRAVRTPSRTNSDVRINFTGVARPGAPPTILALVGNRNLESEELIAYEVGYRVQGSKQLSLDVAAFYNFYDNLGTFEPKPPFFESSPAPPHLVLPFQFDGKMRGETYGLEVTGNWHVTNNWKLSSSYSLFRMELNRNRDSRDTLGAAVEGVDPEHQFQFQSRLNLPRSFELDAGLYHVSQLRAPRVPGYTRIDLRLGWRPAENFAVTFMTQNLFDAKHPEFAETQGTIATEVQRGIYGKVAWRF